MRYAPLLILALGIAVTAQQAPGRSPSLSGGWVRVDPVGGQSYGGIDAMFPRAQLTPEFAAKLPPEVDQGLGTETTAALGPPHKPGEPYLIPNLQGREPRCNPLGPGGVDVNSVAMFIVTSKDEVVLLRDGGSGGRHIYMDGRAHPEQSRLLPSQAGHSTGRWESGNLVVHTTGFSQAMTAFGRGYRTPETALTEVFRLHPDGRHLTVTYTWNDPKVYVKPHAYQIPFERVPGDGYVLENWCDASIPHPEMVQSIVPPEQLTEGNR